MLGRVSSWGEQSAWPTLFMLGRVSSWGNKAHGRRFFMLGRVSSWGNKAPPGRRTPRFGLTSCDLYTQGVCFNIQTNLRVPYTSKGVCFYASPFKKSCFDGGVRLSRTSDVWSVIG